MKFYYCEENGNILTLESEEQPLKCMINWSKSISEAIENQKRNLQADFDVYSERADYKNRKLIEFLEKVNKLKY